MDLTPCMIKALNKLVERPACVTDFQRSVTRRLLARGLAVEVESATYFFAEDLEITPAGREALHKLKQEAA